MWRLSAHAQTHIPCYTTEQNARLRTLMSDFSETLANVVRATEHRTAWDVILQWVRCMPHDAILVIAVLSAVLQLIDCELSVEFDCVAAIRAAYMYETHYVDRLLDPAKHISADAMADQELMATIVYMHRTLLLLQYSQLSHDLDDPATQQTS
jgi:hypothetical protein